jgi:hypothetical protein
LRQVVARFIYKIRKQIATLKFTVDGRAAASLLLPLALGKLHAWFTFFQCVIFRFCLTKNRPDAGKNQACA